MDDKRTGSRYSSQGEWQEIGNARRTSGRGTNAGRRSSGRPSGRGDGSTGRPNGGRRYQEPRRGRENTGRKKKGHAGLIVLLVLLILAAAAGLFVLVMLGRMGHETISGLTFNGGVSHSGYKNYVLYGVDARDNSLTRDCHSDTIMICSLNKRTKEVRLVSVYRDTYLDNTNGEYRKATECYFFGGPERSISMLNKNLDLDITDYISVNFGAVVTLIDLLGGIDLDISQEEMEYINGYCVENQQVTGVSYTPLTEWGPVHLDGIQALAYCRIRYTEGWDYKRTERQRTVLTLAYQKAKQQGPGALVSIANAMLPEISTSMNPAEIISLVSAIGSYSLGDESGFPFEKTAMVVEGSDVVVPATLASNVSELHSFLYGDSGYTPTDTVQEISSYISSVSGVY